MIFQSVASMDLQAFRIVGYFLKQKTLQKRQNLNFKGFKFQRVYFKVNFKKCIFKSLGRFQRNGSCVTNYERYVPTTDLLMEIQNSLCTGEKTGGWGVLSGANSNQPLS